MISAVKKKKDTEKKLKICDKIRKLDLTEKKKMETEK